MQKISIKKFMKLNPSVKTKKHAKKLIDNCYTKKSISLNDLIISSKERFNKWII